MKKKAILHTKKWIEHFVIHYQLCPFPQVPFSTDTIRYVLYEEENIMNLLVLLEEELIKLTATEATKIETTLIICPNVLENFYDFNDFLTIVNDLIFALQLEGEIQVASFHPLYQFHATDIEDVTNFTNRSPYPLLHLLREASIQNALIHYENPENIPIRNQQLMQRLGKEKLNELLERIKHDTSRTD